MRDVGQRARELRERADHVHIGSARRERHGPGRAGKREDGLKAIDGLVEPRRLGGELPWPRLLS